MIIDFPQTIPSSRKKSASAPTKENPQKALLFLFSQSATFPFLSKIEINNLLNAGCAIYTFAFSRISSKLPHISMLTGRFPRFSKVSDRISPSNPINGLISSRTSTSFTVRSIIVLPRKYITFFVLHCSPFKKASTVKALPPIN